MTDLEPVLIDLSRLSLDDLARIANEENRFAEAEIHQALTRLGTALAHAIRCGEVLAAAERLVPPAVWRQWQTDHLDFSPTTASNYRRIAAYRDHLPQGERLTITGALTHLRGLPRTGRPHGPRPMRPQAERDEATRLRKSGLSNSQVAAALDVNRETVRRWTNPAVAKTHDRASAQRRRIVATALAAQRRSESVKKTGGRIDKAYALVRQALAEVDAALGDATDRQIKFALRAATSGLHAAEDAIVRASKIS